MKINGCKIAASVLMLLAACMLLLPFCHFSFPSYFEQADDTLSGVQLIKTGFSMTDGKMEDAVEGVRTLIKDSEDLEDVYKSLGKISKLVATVKVCTVVCLCLPCLLLVAGAIVGLLAKTKKAQIAPLALNVLAFLIHGVSGALAMVLFYYWKGRLTDGVESMESVSTGISFLDTILDTASSVVSENIDKIKLSLQPGWFLLLALALAALVCQILVMMKKEEVVASEVLSDDGWADPFDHIDDGQAIGNGPMGVVEDAKEDAPTYKRVPPQDVNSYQGLPQVNPAQPSARLRGLEGFYNGKVIPLGPNKLVMGRDTKVANLIFGAEAGKVSRRHCEISYEAAQRKYRIKDFSKNGVFIHTCEAGRYVSQGNLPQNQDCLLAAGTIIDIGGGENRFRLE